MPSAFPGCRRRSMLSVGIGVACAPVPDEKRETRTEKRTDLARRLLNYARPAMAMANDPLVRHEARIRANAQTHKGTVTWPQTETCCAESQLESCRALAPPRSFFSLQCLNKGIEVNTERL